MRVSLTVNTAAGTGAGVLPVAEKETTALAEEVGELKDSLDPTLATPEDEDPVDMEEHLDGILDAVFRALKQAGLE